MSLREAVSDPRPSDQKHCSVMAPVRALLPVAPPPRMYEPGASVNVAVPLLSSADHASLGPVAPVPPVRPVAPVWPVWPVAPVAPVWPAGPVFPVWFQASELSPLAHLFRAAM